MRPCLCSSCPRPRSRTPRSWYGAATKVHSGSNQFICKRVPLPPNASGSNEPNSSPPVCAAYRYQPTDCRDPALAPKLLARQFPKAKRFRSSLDTSSWNRIVWPDGSGAHCATYQLDNHGATELKLALPADARLVSASLDGQSLDVAKPTDNSQPPLIRLPAQTRSTKLSLYLETRGPPLAAGRELTPPSILNELPFVAGDWTVWLPEEYSATGTGLSDAAPKFNWRERLFGVLGRPTGSRPFNPFRLADGAALVNGIADGNVSGSSTDASKTNRQYRNLIKTITSPPQSRLHQWRRQPPAGEVTTSRSSRAAPRRSWSSIRPRSPLGQSRCCWRVSYAAAGSDAFNAEAFVVALAAAAALGLLLPVRICKPGVRRGSWPSTFANCRLASSLDSCRRIRAASRDPTPRSRSQSSSSSPSALQDSVTLQSPPPKNAATRRRR